MLSNCEIESKSEIIESESDLSANEIESESCIRGNKPVQHRVKTEISKTSHILENARHGCLAAKINSTIKDIDVIQSQLLTEISDPEDVHSHEQIKFAQSCNMISENCNVCEIYTLCSDRSEREIIVESVICDITYSNDHLYLDRLFSEQARNCIPVKESGLISWPEIQPSKIQKGYPVRQMISMTQFKDQVSNMNKNSLHLCSYSELYHYICFQESVVTDNLHFMLKYLLWCMCVRDYVRESMAKACQSSLVFFQ